MLSFIEYINKVATTCRELYSLKQRLAEQSFAPYDLFRAIDTSLKGHIDEQDLTSALGITQRRTSLLVRMFSEGDQGIRFSAFKQIIQYRGARHQLQHKMDQDEVMLLVRDVLEKECEYAVEAIEIRKQLQRLQVREMLELFQQFDRKNLYYIEAKDIVYVLKQANIETNRYLELVLEKEFSYSLISFQEFYEFFERNKELVKAVREYGKEKDRKVVRFKQMHEAKTPSKQTHKTASKDTPVFRSRTPKKYHTISPQRATNRTLDHSSPPADFLQYFNPLDLSKDLFKSCQRYFKVYSIYQ